MFTLLLMYCLCHHKVFLDNILRRAIDNSINQLFFPFTVHYSDDFFCKQNSLLSVGSNTHSRGMTTYRQNLLLWDADSYMTNLCNHVNRKYNHWGCRELHIVCNNDKVREFLYIGTVNTLKFSYLYRV